MVVLAASGVWRLWRAPAYRAVLGCAIVALPVSLFLADLFKPIIVPRYFITGAAPFLILAGIGVATLPRRAQIAVCALCAGLALINLLPYYRAETKPRWDLAGTEIAPLVRYGDVILLQGNSRRASIQQTMFSFSALRVKPILAATFTPSVADAARALRAGHRVWALYGRVGAADVREPAETYLETLKPLGVPRQQFVEGEEVRVWLFTPPARPSR